MKISDSIIKNRVLFLLSVGSFILDIFGQLMNISMNVSSNCDLILSNNNIEIKNFSNFDNFILILSNNLKSTFILILGCLSFGITTFIGLFINGISDSILLSGIDIKSFLIYIFPYGIFENFAMFIAGVAGFKIPYEITLYLLDKKEKP